jgi:uncharacterized membrane protein
MVDTSKLWTIGLARGVEAAAGVVIGLAVLQAAYQSVIFFLRRSSLRNVPESVRLTLGKWLALALEFELAADILRTAVAPTWNEIGQLASVIVLRTALNYFLAREINQSTKREAADTLPTSKGTHDSGNRAA